MIYSERIRHLRKLYRMTQDDLAEKLEVKRHTICDWESGRTEPNLKYLKKVAEALNITVDYLVGFDNTEVTREYVIVTKFRTRYEMEHNILTSVTKMTPKQQEKLKTMIYCLKTFKEEV